MDYDEWNNAIGRYFFNAQNCGKEVLLFVNDERLNEIGLEDDATVADFISAVKKKAAIVSGGNLCKRALQLYDDWREAKYEYPPYLAYLAFFVLATTAEGDFDPNAYYPRYWALLNEPGQGAPHGFYDTADLWEDLEKWTVEDKKEQLGRFKARIRGKWRHVGRPLSQTLLSEDERKALPEIFRDCGFDPTNIPSEATIKNGLLQHGDYHLRKRTIKLLKSQAGENEEFVNSLLDLVITELEQWGKYEVTSPIEEKSVPSEKQHAEKTAPVPSLFLRTCLEIDTPKQHVRLSLRLKTNRQYPEDELKFEIAGKVLFCTETYPVGWSTQLTEVSANAPLDPATLDWSKNWTFEAENGWTASYKSQEFRLFRPGEEEACRDSLSLRSSRATLNSSCSAAIPVPRQSENGVRTPVKNSLT